MGQRLVLAYLYIKPRFVGLGRDGRRSAERACVDLFDLGVGRTGRLAGVVAGEGVGVV